MSTYASILTRSPIASSYPDDCSGLCQIICLTVSTVLRLLPLLLLRSSEVPPFPIFYCIKSGPLCLIVKTFPNLAPVAFLGFCHFVLQGHSP